MSIPSTDSQAATTKFHQKRINFGVAAGAAAVTDAQTENGR